MARYIDADKLLEELNEELMYESTMFSKEQEEYLQKGIRIAIGDVKRFPTSDVAPKSEVERPMFENTKQILHLLKRQIHEKAVYPHNAGIDAYISLKVFDAILQTYLNHLE